MTLDDFINIKEDDEGKIEYKWLLTNLSDERINHLVSQMKFRLQEGNGECFYEIGLKDNGFPEGITEEEFNETHDNLIKIAEKCDSSVRLLQKKNYKNKFLGEYLIRENPKKNNYIDLSILVAGNVDAAKSSTIGCLISGKLDNGRGLSRTQVFNFRHEIESGRTSSISHQIMGFNQNGVVNHSKVRKLSWPEIVQDSNKIITFYDLAGHEKYLRTTIYGFSSTYSDYAMIMIGANMGVTAMTKEHIALCLTYKIPFFIVYTKIDIAPENVYEKIKNTVKKIMNSTGVRKIIVEIKDIDNAILCSKNMLSDNIVPTIEISNVTGQNHQLLIDFLNLLPQRKDFSQYENEPIKLTIDEKYTVNGVGTVVSGVLHRGTVKLNDNVLIGPDGTGNYLKTQIKGIHCKRVSVDEVKAGSYVCFNIKKIPKIWVKKGMVILSTTKTPQIVWMFEAEINILQSHSTTIKVGYEPNIHINNLSQVCVIQSIEKIGGDKDEYLRAGDKAYVKLCFKYRPVYLSEGNRIVFREGRVRGIGIIKNVIFGKRPEILNNEDKRRIRKIDAYNYKKT